MAHGIVVADDMVGDALSQSDGIEAKWAEPWMQSFLGVILCLVFYVFLQVLVVAGPLLFSFSVMLRSVLWVALIIATVMTILRGGAGALLKVTGIIAPFFLFGVLSALASVDPLPAVPELVLWLLGVLGAGVIATSVPAERVQRLLFWIFLALITVSIVEVLSLPDIGRLADNRVAGGAWRGLLPGKNQFGSVCAFAMLLPLYVRRIPLLFRIVLLLSAAVCVAMSASSGAVLLAASGLGFCLILRMVRALRLSAGLKPLVLFVIVASIAVLGLGAQSLLLQALGRDATLTGRTEIWAAYLQRAQEHWLSGAGPGTFTQESSVTADVGRQFVELGAIHTPHNMFIAAFGEVGLFGLLAFVLPMFYAAFVLPFRGSAPAARLCAGIGFMMVVGGIGETREVFGTGIFMFLLILTHGMARLTPEPTAEPSDVKSAATPQRSPFPDEPVPGYHVPVLA